jgi:hypothetical protein
MPAPLPVHAEAAVVFPGFFGRESSVFDSDDLFGGGPEPLAMADNDDGPAFPAGSLT